MRQSQLYNKFTDYDPIHATDLSLQTTITIMGLVVNLRNTELYFSNTLKTKLSQYSFNQI